MTARRASHSSPGVLQIRHITAFRELEPSRLGGRSLCIEGAAGERCDGGSGKVSFAWRVTIVWQLEHAARAILSLCRDRGTGVPRVEKRGGRRAEAGSACPFLWHCFAALHGRVHCVRDRAGGQDG